MSNGEAQNLRYEAGVGIRPPNKRGKVRGVIRELEDGGGMEVGHCDHDHAPGVHSCQVLTPGQRAEAQDCAARWAQEQIDAGHLMNLPVVREEW